MLQIKYFKKNKRTPYKTDSDDILWLNAESVLDAAFVALDLIAEPGDVVSVSDHVVRYKFRVRKTSNGHLGLSRVSR